WRRWNPVERRSTENSRRSELRFEFVLELGVVFKLAQRFFGNLDYARVVRFRALELEDTFVCVSDRAIEAWQSPTSDQRNARHLSTGQHRDRKPSRGITRCTTGRSTAFATEPEAPFHRDARAIALSR